METEGASAVRVQKGYWSRPSEPEFGLPPKGKLREGRVKVREKGTVASGSRHCRDPG